MVKIFDDVSAAIRRHGQDSYGDEACGVIYGTCQNGSKVVLAVDPLANARDGERHRRFLITPHDYLRAEEGASSRGMELLGFYHSHPNHPAYPSDYDLEHAWPVFSYVIVSVRDGEPKEMRSFVLESDRSRFTEEEIQITNQGE